MRVKSEEFSEASEGHLKYLVLVGRTQSTMRPTLNTAHFSKLDDNGIQQGRLRTETSRSSTALKILSLSVSLKKVVKTVISVYILVEIHSKLGTLLFFVHRYAQ